MFFYELVGGGDFQFGLFDWECCNMCVVLVFVINNVVVGKFVQCVVDSGVGVVKFFCQIGFGWQECVLILDFCFNLVYNFVMYVLKVGFFLLLYFRVLC